MNDFIPGIYDADKHTILAHLGLLTITTVEPKSEVFIAFSAFVFGDWDVSHFQKEMDGMDKMSRLREKAYDRFRVKLSNVVVAFAEVYDII